MQHDAGQILIAQDAIARRVGEMARQITADHHADQGAR